jgi:hypothetical protein
MFKVTYKEPGATQLMVKHFKNRQVADTFIKELKTRFVSIEEVSDDESQ